jgi:hypothetical protein
VCTLLLSFLFFLCLTPLSSFPGGSLSNTYGWLSCQLRQNQVNAQPCSEGWESFAARPSDFLQFLIASNTVGMWVVNPSATKEESAALVAFINGAVGDTRSIGTDRNGFNWRTVGHWAQLRAAALGTNTPYPIRLWAFGNEVYGTKNGVGVSQGDTCKAWGWETFWTCSGTEYVTGIPGHDGYLAVRAAMRAVDPSITVAPLSTVPFSDYDNWSNEVSVSRSAFLSLTLTLTLTLALALSPHSHSLSLALSPPSGGGSSVGRKQRG